MPPDVSLKDKPPSGNPERKPTLEKMAIEGTARLDQVAQEKMRPSTIGGVLPLTVEESSSIRRTQGKAAADQPDSRIGADDQRTQLGVNVRKKEKAIGISPEFPHSSQYSAPYGNETIEVTHSWQNNTKSDGSSDGTYAGNTRYAVGDKVVNLYWQENQNGHKKAEYAVESFKDINGDTVHKYFDCSIDGEGRSTIDYNKDRGQVVIHSNGGSTDRGGFVRTPQDVNGNCQLILFDSDKDIVSRQKISAEAARDSRVIAALEKQVIPTASRPAGPGPSAGNNGPPVADRITPIQQNPAVQVNMSEIPARSERVPEISSLPEAKQKSPEVTQMAIEPAEAPKPNYDEVNSGRSREIFGDGSSLEKWTDKDGSRYESRYNERGINIGRKRFDANGKELGSIEVKSVSDKFAKEALDGYDALPEHIRDQFEKAGYKLVIGPHLLHPDIRPDLANVPPRGFPPGTTLDTVGSILFPEEKTAYILEHIRLGNSWQATSDIKAGRTKTMIAHEVGHAIDTIWNKNNKVFSESDDFKKAYEEDVSNLNATSRSALAYYLQGGNAGREEAFAEMFAYNIHGLLGLGFKYDDQSVARCFPKTRALIQKQMDRH